MTPMRLSDRVTRPVRDSWRQINADSWIIGEKLLLTRHSSKPCDNAWTDEKGNFFMVCETNDPPASSLQPDAASAFPLVYDASDAHCVWNVGNAFVKIIIPSSPHVTREHVTLDALHNMDLDFTIPNVLYHGEWDGMYHIILTKVPGQTLHEAWPLLSEQAKEDCVRKVANICKLLATREETYIGGIDGNHLPEYYLTKTDGDDFSPDMLLQNCKEVGMDCSTFVFYHCDLGPGNILVDLADGRLGIIDWECAGFVPKEWVRTNFSICGGLDFELPQGTDARYDWRSRMQKRLAEEGFVEVAHAWVAWKGRNRED